MTAERMQTMGRTSEYSGSLTREKFLFFETRVAAKLLAEGEKREAVMSAVRAENLFQFPTERMVTSICNTCIRRLENLDSAELIQIMAAGSQEDAKLVNLYAMMRDNRIVWDFMTTVVGEKYRTQDYELAQSDFNLFLLRLQEQNDQIAAWSESTGKKVKQVLRRTLIECGYLDSAKATRLNPVFPCAELVEVIRQNKDYDALAAFHVFTD